MVGGQAFNMKEETYKQRIEEGEKNPFGDRLDLEEWVNPRFLKYVCVGAYGWPDG